MASLDKSERVGADRDRRRVVGAGDGEGNRLGSRDRRGDRLSEIDREAVGYGVGSGQRLGVVVRVAERVAHHARGDGVGGRAVDAGLGVGERVVRKGPRSRRHGGGVDRNGRVGFRVYEGDGGRRAGRAGLVVAGLLEGGRRGGRGDRSVVRCVVDGDDKVLGVRSALRIRDGDGERVGGGRDEGVDAGVAEDEAVVAGSGAEVEGAERVHDLAVEGGVAAGVRDGARHGERLGVGEVDVGLGEGARVGAEGVVGDGVVDVDGGRGSEHRRVVGTVDHEGDRVVDSDAGGVDAADGEAVVDDVAELQLLRGGRRVSERVAEQAGGAIDDGGTVGACVGEGVGGDDPAVGAHPGRVEADRVVSIGEGERRGGRAGTGVGVAQAAGLGQLAGSGGGRSRRRIVGAGDGEHQVLAGGVDGVAVDDREGVGNGGAGGEGVSQRLGEGIRRDLGGGAIGNGAVSALLGEDDAVAGIRPAGRDEGGGAVLVRDRGDGDRGGGNTCLLIALLDEGRGSGADGERRGVVAARDGEGNLTEGGEAGLIGDVHREGVGGGGVLDQGLRIGVGVVEDVVHLVVGEHEGGRTVGARLRIGDAGVGRGPASSDERGAVVADRRRGILVGEGQRGERRGGSSNALASLDKTSRSRVDRDRRRVVGAGDGEGDLLGSLNHGCGGLLEVDREGFGLRIGNSQRVGDGGVVIEKVGEFSGRNDEGSCAVGSALRVGCLILRECPSLASHGGIVNLDRRTSFRISNG